MDDSNEIEVLNLSGEEDIQTLRTMIARSPAERVLFVVPRKHPALRELVRLKLLARQAYTEGTLVALVTKDATIRDFARLVNLSVFRSVKAGRRARDWRSGQEIPPPDALTLSDTAMREERRHAVLERQSSVPQPIRWSDHLMLAGLVFGMMIVLSSILLLLGPSASITLVPHEEDHELIVPITIDRSAQEITFGQSIIPGTLIEQDVQGTREMAASGRQDVPAEVATGSVLFINATGQPIEIAANTIVSTSSGTPIRFRTTETVPLTGSINSRVSVPIEAIRTGPSGNVGPQQINRVEGAAASVVRVLNEQGTEGGTVEQRAVVTAADQEQLRKQSRQQLFQAGRAALENKVAEMGEDQILVPGMIDIDIVSENFNGIVSDQLDVLKLDMRAKVSAFVISQRDIERVSKRQLKSEIPLNYQMLEDQLIVTPNEAEIGEDGLPIMPVRALTRFRAQLSGEQIRRLVRGQPIDDAQSALSQHLPLATDPSIVVTPDWWNRMPYLSLRIFIYVDTLEQNQALLNP
ncbi:MAG: baseplate J/gp47 family protein [Ardenticatenaceae bacterium]